jgi:hypothetical protein
VGELERDALAPSHRSPSYAHGVCGGNGARERRVQEGGVAAAAPRPLATRGRQSAPGLLPTLAYGRMAGRAPIGGGLEAAAAWAVTPRPPASPILELLSSALNQEQTAGPSS